MQRLRNSLAKRGLGGTIALLLPWAHERLRRIGEFVAEYRFDRRHQVDTRGIVHHRGPRAIGHAYEQAVRYQSTPPSVFRSILTGLPIEHDRFVFVDYGSGKGKVLLLASYYPFRRIVGVELDPELHRIAAENVRRFSAAGQRCTSFEVVCMDAAEYRLPAEPVVLYLYHPFKEELMGKTLASIEASLEQDPRELYLVYYNPVLEDLIDRSSSLQRVGTGRDYVLYSSVSGVRSPA